MATQRMYALFQTVYDAERAIGALQDHGVPKDCIGVIRRAAETDEADRVRDGYVRSTGTAGPAPGEPLASYDQRSGYAGAQASTSTLAPANDVDTADNVAVVGKSGITTTTPEDAAVGAAVGGEIGLLAGLAAATAALFIPGVGLVVIGGLAAAGLGAAVATAAAGAVVGGVVGYLRDMGMPQQAAEAYADRLKDGDYLLSIDCESVDSDELKQILMKYNAAGVDFDMPLPAAAGVA